MEESKTITVSKFEYDNLNRIKYKYELILNIVINNTYLSYNNKDLNYEGDDMCEILKIIEPDYYKIRLRYLSGKEEENE